MAKNIEIKPFTKNALIHRWMSIKSYTIWQSGVNKTSKA